jgi:two-component system, NtrC family, response regulator HupR/HoxA
MSEPALLVVDDEEAVLALIPQLFDGDIPVLTARSGKAALELLGTHEIGVVLADQRMPGMKGTELLALVAAQWPETVRMLLTAFADVENLLQAINSGRVYQFVVKPWDNRELATAVRRAMDTYRLRAHNARLLVENTRLVRELEVANVELERENRVLRTQADDRYRAGSLIGASPAMQDVCRLLDKASESEATVLLRGETGTGKELAASWVHANGPRRRRRFVAVNCGALPDSLLESELFGHVRGAFTGAVRDRQGVFVEAHGGTIFLDEIGEMSPGMQVKVLRVVEDGLVRPVGASSNVKVDVRLVCATNRDLKSEVEAGSFRRDLYYRLNVFPITLPPLRSRAGDVALLASHFLHRFSQTAKKEIPGFTAAARHCLGRYSWPGNVRELKNEVQRAVALAEPGCSIDLEHLSAEVTGDESLHAAADGDGRLDERLERVEQLLILKELRRHGENRTHTARTLGISVRALQKKIARYGLRESAERADPETTPD